ncbi:hypothetical protein [Woodsholea maritima]|uniref:hypothetical protein n=1 Tax=Woodsholea maritima TaxID=240237 RepID=UPI000377FAEB|nr:hypothetical protein [Woodsholea maritima]
MIKHSLLASIMTGAVAISAHAQDSSFDGLAGHVEENVNGNMEMNGASVSFTGRVTGDLIMNGAAVSAEATVLGNVDLNGGSVSFEGNVAGSSTINSGALTLQGQFAGPVEIQAGAATLDGDFAEALSINAGKVELDGRYAGPIRIYTEANSGFLHRRDRSRVTLKGDYARGGEVCSYEVRLDDNIRIGGPLVIMATERPDVPSGVNPDLITFTDQPEGGCQD